MAGPWEKYASPAPAAEDGPWSKYAPAPAAAPEKPGYGASLARGAVQGLTLGLADESYGLTQGVASMLRGEGFQKGYDEGVGRYRGDDKAAKEANPITSVVGEVAGAIPGVVGLGMTGVGARALGLTGPNLASRSVASAGSGGAIGAVQGFNNGEGNVGERMEAAWAPSATGAALGAVSPVVGLGVGKAVDASTRALRGVGTVPQGMTGAAADMLADDFARAGGSAAIRSRMTELGPDAMLLDASPSLQGRAQGLAIQPETREGIVAPLMARNRATNARLSADVDGAIGPAPVPSQIEAGLAASRDATAEAYAPVMGAARAGDTRVLADRLDEAAINLRGPAQRAVLDVRRMLNIPGNPHQLDPNPQALHSVREAIDGLMSTEQNPQVIRQLTMARQQVDQALATAAPGIKPVDARMSELYRQSEGLERGARVLDSGRTAVRPSELAQEFTESALPQGQMVGPSAVPVRMRQGLRADIDREIGNRANDLEALKKVIKGDGDWNRAKLATVFGQEQADTIIASVDREAAFRGAYNKIVENSQAAQRLAGAEGVKVGASGEGGAGLADAGTAISTAVGGAPGAALSIGGRGLRLAGAEAKRAADMARNEGLMRALTTNQGPQLDAIVRGIERRIGVHIIAETTAERARGLSQILMNAQGYQGSRALPESLRPSK